METLRNDLQRADVLIFVGTPGALRSRWNLAELDFFYNDRKRFILPIIFANLIRSDELPEILKGILYLHEDESFLSVGPSPAVLSRLLTSLEHYYQLAIPTPSPSIPRLDEKRPLNEGKLILVGRGEVGKDESDQNTLRWVLHCLGIALNYRDDSRLRDTSVLKPEWVTQGIYKIVNAKKLAERQGELDLIDLQQLLPKDRYPHDKHLFLLELMRKFSLCFPFPDEPDWYLVPELLGKEQPEETTEFPPQDCLNFEYYYGILPEGLIPRFIVRSHTLSRGQQRWRSGVILAHEDCKALVTAEPADRRVIVRVKGENSSARRRLLAIIRYDLDRIHAEFKDRLDALPKVPLTEFPEFSVDYKKLVAFEKQGVSSFPEFIGERVITVQVNELLNGVDLEQQRKDSLEALTKAKAIFFA
jgi:GTPase SAR1 family protein